MYEALAREAGAPIASELMEETLAGHFCPFRSPLWAQLERRRESIEFSQALWVDVLEIARPGVLLCLGETARLMREVLDRQGAQQLGAPAVHRVEMGDITLSISRHATLAHETVLVGLPHLSRFPFFGRPQSRSAVAAFTEAVVPALSAYRPALMAVA
jgi:hypothetical protein